jgi:adenylate cyclase
MAESEQWSPEQVRLFMMGEHPAMARQRRFFGRFPSEPRCKLCAVPFSGLGGMAFRRAGFGRSANPALCMKCTIELGKAGVTGVEIPCTLLFSDVRGSTALGERMRPSEFHAFLDQFYRLATRVILDNDGIVDKLVGDEVIGLFFGGVSGPDHAAAGIRAALDLANEASRPVATEMGAIPVGTAVHTGDAFVGATGPAGTVEGFTALGDTVNTAARLASAAGAGEVLVSVAASDAAHTLTDGHERRTLPIRGRIEPVEVVVLRSSGATAGRDRPAGA